MAFIVAMHRLAQQWGISVSLHLDCVCRSWSLGQVTVPVKHVLRGVHVVRLLRMKCEFEGSEWKNRLTSLWPRPNHELYKIFIQFPQTVVFIWNCGTLGVFFFLFLVPEENIPHFLELHGAGFHVLPNCCVLKSRVGTGSCKSFSVMQTMFSPDVQEKISSFCN